MFDEVSHAGTTVEDMLVAYERGEVPVHWFANICSRPDGYFVQPPESVT